MVCAPYVSMFCMIASSHRHSRIEEAGDRLQFVARQSAIVGPLATGTLAYPVSSGRTATSPNLDGQD
jgi:hypothetical protein